MNRRLVCTERFVAGVKTEKPPGRADSGEDTASRADDPDAGKSMAMYLRGGARPVLSRVLKAGLRRPASAASLVGDAAPSSLRSVSFAASPGPRPLRWSPSAPQQLAAVPADGVQQLVEVIGRGERVDDGDAEGANALALERHDVELP